MKKAKGIIESTHTLIVVCPKCYANTDTRWKSEHRFGVESDKEINGQVFIGDCGHSITVYTKQNR